MSVELKPDVERRLCDLAAKQPQTPSQLLEEIVTRYLQGVGDAPQAWVDGTQSLLQQVWPAEGFSDWSPPYGR